MSFASIVFIFRKCSLFFAINKKNALLNTLHIIVKNKIFLELTTKHFFKKTKILLITKNMQILKAKA